MASLIPDWLKVANSCYSSYKKNDLGWVLYGLVRAHKPIVCVELGVLEGYSAIFTAAALRDNTKGTLYAYDLFEDYPYRHASKEQAARNISVAALDSVELRQQDARNAPTAFRSNGVEIDFLHVDLSNDGVIFEWAMRTFGDLLSENGIMVFEGGSEERDYCDWMLEHNKVPIRSVLDNLSVMKDWEWFVIESYPSMTVMRPR